VFFVPFSFVPFVVRLSYAATSVFAGGHAGPPLHLLWPTDTWVRRYTCSGRRTRGSAATPLSR